MLWGDDEGNRRYHLVRWNEEKKPLVEGALDLL